MKLRSIHIQNFGSFKECFYQFPDNDLIFLEGINNDENKSNGSGKTTFIEAIPFALYGRVLRDGNRKKSVLKDVIRTGTKVSKVELILEDQKRVFEISREVTATGSTFKIKHNEEVLMGQYAQDFLSKYLDLGYNSFISSCVFGGGLYNIFLNATETERVGLLEDLFRLTEITRLLDNIKTDFDKKGDLLVTQSQELTMLEGDYRAIEAKYNVFKSLYETNRIEAQKILADPTEEVYTNKISNLEIKIKTNESDIADLENEIQQNESKIQSLQYKLNKFSDLTVGTACPTCGQVVGKKSQERLEYEFQFKDHEKRLEDIKGLVIKDRDKRKVLITVNTQFQLDLVALTTKKEQLDKEKTRALEVLSTSEEVLEQQRVLFQNKETTYTALKGKVNKLVEERDAMDKLRRMLNRKELRGLIVNSYLDLVNKYVNKYVSFVTDGKRSLEFTFKTDNIKAILKHKDQGKLPYFRYSGGERRRIDFALFLAFNRVNKHIFKNPLDLLLLDEPLESLDAPGMDKIIELLKLESKELGLSLFTSHIEGISESFPNKISILKEKGVSKLV